MVDSIPAGALWSVCAIGRNQLPMNMIAMASIAATNAVGSA